MAQNQRPVTGTPTNPYGNSPKSLKPKVEEEDFDAELAMATAASAAAPRAPAAEADPFEAELAAALSAETAPPAVPPGEEEVIVEEDPTFAQANLTPGGIKTQITDAYQRLRGAFTGTDREQLNDLKKQGVYQDVRQDDNGNVLIKRHGAKKYEKLDKKTVEILGDAIDGARVAFEAGTEMAGKIVGTVAGAAAGLPAGGVGAIPGGVAGYAAGGAASALAAQQAGDAFAEYGLGIERDPSRSRGKEAATTAGLGMIFGGLGGTMARRAANSAAKREAFAITSDFVTKKADEAVQAINEVRNSGIKLDENGHFFLDPAQTAGDILPEFTETYKKLGSDPRVQAFRLQQGKTLSDAFDTVTRMIGNETGATTGKVANFALDAKNIRQFEGATVGKFRNAALENSKGAPQPMAKLGEKLGSVLEELGIGANEAMRIARPQNAKSFGIAAQNAFPELTESQANYYGKTVADLQASMNRGKGTMSLKDIDTEYNLLTSKINSLMKSQNGKDLGYRLIELKNGLRDDWISAIGANTPPGQKAAYEQALAKYSGTMKSIENLKGVLKNETVSMDALADHLFKPGIGKGDQIKSVKSLYMDSDPQAWKEITSHYMNSVRNRFKDGDQVNWKGFRNEINKLPADVQEQLFEGSGITKPVIESLSKLGEAVNKADVNFTPSTAQRGLIKRTIYLMANTMASAKLENAEGLLNGLGRDKAVGIWLKEGGAQQLLKEMPNSPGKKRFLKFMDMYDPNKQTKLTTAVRAGARAGARQSVQKTLGPVIGGSSEEAMSTEAPE